MKSPLVALASDNPFSLSRRLPEGARWLFLGQDFLRLRHFERAMGKERPRIEINRLLDSVVSGLRGSYVEWIDSMSRKRGSDPTWWASPLANRNPIQNPIFQHTCYLETVRKIIESGETPDLFVTEDAGLARAVVSLLREKNIPVRKYRPLRFLCLRLLDPIVLSVYVGWFLCAYLKRFIAAALSGPGPAASDLKTTGPKPVVLLDTYVYASQFREGAAYRDRHFPFLIEWLERNGYSVYIFPTTSGVKKFRELRTVFSGMRRSGHAFLLREDWLKPSDYIAAIIAALGCFGHARASGRFRGLDVKPILMHHAWRPMRIEALLTYRFFFRLKDAGFSPSIAIDWYENQDIDKGLALGCRACFPKARIIGAELMPPTQNYLNLFPSPAESECGVAPDAVVTIGEHSQKTFPSEFGSALGFTVGAALRYAYLWEYRREKPREPGCVLVALPSRLDESVEILCVVSRAVESCPGVKRWLIKPHPDLRIEEIRSVMDPGDWHDNYEPVEGHLLDAMSRASVVVTAGSGAAIEAAVFGVPVVNIARQNSLNFNVLAWFPEAGRLCYDSRDVAEAVGELIALDDSELQRFQAQGLRLRKFCFAPVNEETLRKFVDPY